MVRRLGFLLLLGFALSAGAASAVPELPPRPAVKAFTEGMGLPNLACQDLVQDPQGQVWVGTQKGLARYVGGRFQTFDGPPGLEHTWVTHVFATSAGLWVGTAMDGLLFRGPKGWKTWKTAGGVPLRRITQCVEDGQGRILVVALGSPVLRVEGEQLVPQEGMPQVPVTALLKRPEGWLAASSQGLWKENAGQWELDREIQGTVFCLAASKDQVLVGSARGTYLGRSGFWTVLKDLSGEALQVACPGPGLAGGEAFWATNRQKLFCIEGQRVQEIPFVPYGIPPQVLKVSVTGAQGTRQVWLSTYNGLYRLQSRGWNRLDPDLGPGNGISFGLAQALDGSTWFGDSQGRVHRFREGHWQSWALEKKAGKSVISTLCALEGPEGGVLAALSLSGLWHWDGRTWTNPGLGELKAGVTLTNLRSGQHRGEAGAWAGTELGLYFWSPKRGLLKVIDYGRPVRWVLPDPSHPGWVYFGGMTEDVLRWDGEAVHRIAELKGTRFTTAAAWVKGQEGRLFRLGSYAGGVTSLDADGAVKAHWAREGLAGWPSDAVLSLACDREGRTWVGTDSGVVVMSGSGQLLTTYTQQDGLPSDLCTQNALLTEDPRRIWISTSRGVAHLSLSDLAPVDPPQLRLLSLSSEAGPFDLGATLRHPARHVVIAFDLPLLHREEDVRYRALMEGLDVRQAPWTTTTSASFPTLPAGSYRLNVWAMDGQGRQVGPLRVPFQVAPSPWLHPGMLALYALAFGGLGFAVVRTKTAQLEARNRQLSEAVAKATTKLHVINDRLYHLNDEKNRIIGVAAHDLRNPLSGILLTCELMQEDLTEEQAMYVDRIRQQGRIMNDLMTDLLNVHAIEANAAEAPRVDVLEAHALLWEVYPSHAEKAAAKDITLHLEIHEGTVPVLGDQRQLLRVLDNLVSNALKFTPSHRQVWIRCKVEGQSVCFEIQDEGPGLTPEDLTRVFGAYARLSATPTAGESSVGLGLSIVKKLTEGMGGTIGVDSVAGQGATFWVRLPKPPEGLGN